MIWQQVAVCWQERLSCWQIKRREDAETTPLPWYVSDDAPPPALKLPSCCYLVGIRSCAKMPNCGGAVFQNKQKYRL